MISSFLFHTILYSVIPLSILLIIIAVQWNCYNSTHTHCSIIDFLYDLTNIEAKSLASLFFTIALFEFTSIAFLKNVVNYFDRHFVATGVYYMGIQYEEKVDLSTFSLNKGNTYIINGTPYILVFQEGLYYYPKGALVERFIKQGDTLCLRGDLYPTRINQKLRKREAVHKFFDSGIRTAIFAVKDSISDFEHFDP